MSMLCTIDELLKKYGEDALEPAWLGGLTLENEDEQLIVPTLRTRMTLQAWLSLPSDERDFIVQLFAESFINI